MSETNHRKQRSLLLLLTLCCLLTTFLCSAAFAQESGPPSPPPSDAGGPTMDRRGPPPGAFEAHRPPMERALNVGPRGKWWNDPAFVKLLSLTNDQQRKMEDIFEQNRPKLTDLSSNLRQQEETMRPLLEADQPDEGKVLAQIDQIAQARAALEKTNARMLLGLRRVLTPDQWRKLQAYDPARHGPADGHRDAGRNSR